MQNREPQTYFCGSSFCVSGDEPMNSLEPVDILKHSPCVVGEPKQISLANEVYKLFPARTGNNRGTGRLMQRLKR
jgi:hypothetical protein